VVDQKQRNWDPGTRERAAHGACIRWMYVTRAPTQRRSALVCLLRGRHTGATASPPSHTRMNAAGYDEDAGVQQLQA
jgi:hypothetical protein